jgi:hypothetical protein
MVARSGVGVVEISIMCDGRSRERVAAPSSIVTQDSLGLRTINTYVRLVAPILILHLISLSTLADCLAPTSAYMQYLHKLEELAASVLSK